ncbi:MAG: BamA/TamA family outer membrane protein [Steroidobacteraceae bacterium]
MNLGFVGDVRAGLATSAFGSDRDAVMLAGNASWAASWRPEQLLSLKGQLGTRVEDGGAQNTDLALTARGYWRWNSRWMSFAGIEGRWTQNLDPDQQVLLGGDNGLRGFPLRFQSGNASALATVEQRLFTSWEPFRLVRVGGAVFFDAGRTWGGPPGPDSGRWLKDVGVGLRLGNSRSSRGNVIHIDLAMPLDATDRVDGL